MTDKQVSDGPLGDPVAMVAAFDRNPAKRFAFIRRHGTDKYLETIHAAKRRAGR